MERATIFELIHSIELVSNEQILAFNGRFSYPVGISAVLVLSHLRSSGQEKPSMLAKRLGYSKGAITNISSKLVHFGLVERVYDENDRRSFMLRITEKGIKALDEAKEIGEAIFFDQFSVLSQDELEQYLKIQRKLLDGIKRKMF